MKRPKLADMNELELLRFRLLQKRRQCLRAFAIAKCVDRSNISPEDNARVNRGLKQLGAILAITKPATINKASLTDCLSVVRAVETINGHTPRSSLN